MNTKKLCLSIATLGPIGYLPAPGTMATLATLPLVYLMRSLITEWWYIGFIMLAFGIGFYVITQALPNFKGITDPSAIVFDELIGCLVTFIATPMTWQMIILGFLLFRFFDISKGFGIHYLEQIPGALGIIVDDVVAGIFSMVVLQFLLCYQIV